MGWWRRRWDRWDGREAETICLELGKTYIWDRLGCIARQTEYGFGAMNEWYVLGLLDAQDQWRLHTFVELFLFNSFLMSAPPGYAVQANLESLPKGALSTRAKFLFELHHRNNWLSRNSIYDSYIKSYEKSVVWQCKQPKRENEGIPTSQERVACPVNTTNRAAPGLLARPHISRSNGVLGWDSAFFFLSSSSNFPLHLSWNTKYPSTGTRVRFRTHFATSCRNLLSNL